MASRLLSELCKPLKVLAPHAEKSPNYRPTTRCIAASLETCSFTL